MKPRRILLLIVILTLFSVFIDLPRKFPVRLNIPLSKVGGQDYSLDQEVNLPILNLTAGQFEIRRDLEIKQGIDLAGGSHLVFQAEMDKIGEDDRDSALEAAKENIARRVDLFGISESVIQTSKLGDDYRLIVELPGVTDVNQAVDLIGQTAQLDFRELSPEATEAATIFDYQATNLTGADLAKSQVQFDSNTGQPVVGLQFNADGGKKFGEITERNVGRPVGIFLDEFPITLPTVQVPQTFLLDFSVV